MKKALLFCLGISFLLVSTAIQAQSQREIWYWAWRSYDLEVEHPEDQRGDLLAFKPDGTINVLLEDVFPIALERVNDTTAFVGGKIDDTYSYYYLTSTQAIPVLELFEQSYVDEMRGNTISIGYKYYMPIIVLAGDNRFLLADTRRDVYAIYDIHANTTTFFHLRAWCDDNCVRVSENGRYIRYRVTPSEEVQLHRLYDFDITSLPYQIYEYDTVTNTERLIYEQSDIHPGESGDMAKGGCTPDEYGERWYCDLYVNSTLLADEKQIIHADGSIETVNPDWRLRVLNNQWYFLDLDRRWNDEDCNPCNIQVFPDGNQAESFEFVVPPRDEFSFWYDEIEMLSVDYLIPSLITEPIFAMSRSGELVELGVRRCCADPTGFDFYDEESGYLVSYNRTVEQTQVWNTRSLELIGQFPPEFLGVRRTFRDYSLVVGVADTSNGRFAVYSYLDETFYEFDSTERNHLDAFDGGVLLFSYGSEQWNYDFFDYQGDGIYRWTEADGEILLIDGAIPIPNR
jgi:hypothetical protein